MPKVELAYLHGKQLDVQIKDDRVIQAEFSRLNYNFVLALLDNFETQT